MRKILAIAGISVIRIARDKKALLMLLAMPMILIGILGMALKDLWSDAGINPFAVTVVNADQAAKPPLPAGAPAALAAQLPTLQFGKVLAEDVMQSDQVKKIIKAQTSTDLDQAKADLMAGKTYAVVYVPPTFTADALAGKAAKVQVFTDAGHSTEANITRQVVASFTDGLTSQLLSQRNMSPEQLAEVSASASADLAKEAQAQAPKLKTVPSGTRSVSAMQYYAAAMAVMFMMMTALGRSATIIEDRQNGTLLRILTTPTARATVIAGQILGTLAVVVLQMALLFLGTRYLYGVIWGDWLHVGLLGLSFAIAASGVGTAVGGLLNDPKAADASVGLVGNLFGALSGAMFPLYIFPDALKLVAKVIPNYWALTGFLDQMSGVGGAHFATSTGVLIAIGLVAGAIGTWRLAGR